MFRSVFDHFHIFLTFIQCFNLFLWFFIFLCHILKIKIYEIIEFMVNIFICEFFALILYVFQIILIFFN